MSVQITWQIWDRMRVRFQACSGASNWVGFLFFTWPCLWRWDTISGVWDEFKPLGVVYSSRNVKVARAQLKGLKQGQFLDVFEPIKASLEKRIKYTFFVGIWDLARLGLHLPSQSLANSYFVKKYLHLACHQSVKKRHFLKSKNFLKFFLTKKNIFQISGKYWCGQATLFWSRCQSNPGPGSFFLPGAMCSWPAMWAMG